MTTYVKSIKSRIDEVMTLRFGDRYTEYRKLWVETASYKEFDFPINIVFDLIDACNLKCHQCPRHEDVKPMLGLDFLGSRKQLSMKQIKKVLDESKKYSLPSLNIGGSGEFLLYENIIEVISYALDSGIIDIRAVSNGILLTEEKFKAFMELGLPVLSISLDATTQETYQKVRGGRLYKPWNNVLRAIELKKEKNALFPLIRVSFVKQEANTQEVEEFLDFWTNKADIVDVQAYIDYRRTEHYYNFECFDPWRRVQIWADGTIAPCCGFPGIHLSIGHIDRNSIHEAWNSKEMKDIRKSLFSRNYITACLQCFGNREGLKENI